VRQSPDGVLGGALAGKPARAARKIHGSGGSVLVARGGQFLLSFDSAGRQGQTRGIARNAAKAATVRREGSHAKPPRPPRSDARDRTQSREGRHGQARGIARKAAEVAKVRREGSHAKTRRPPRSDARISRKVAKAATVRREGSHAKRPGPRRPPGYGALAGLRQDVKRISRYGAKQRRGGDWPGRLRSDRSCRAGVGLPRCWQPDYVVAPVPTPNCAIMPAMSM
jgi:hypothetical protein